MKKVVFLMRLHEGPGGEYSAAVFNWYGVLEHLGYEVFYEDYNSYNPLEFYEKIKILKPDFIFHPTYESFHSEFIKLREFSKVYCVHSDDDWRFDNYIKHWIPFTDGAIGYQNKKEAYDLEGAPENYYFRARWAFNPNTMMHDFSSKKTHALTHVGGFHGNKAQRLLELKNNPNLKTNIHCIEPKYSSYSWYLESYHKSIASLCFTGNSVNTGPQSKTRLAELPYYSVLVSEPWPDMHLWNMEPNKDFVLLENDNSIELLNKVILDKDFGNKMFESGKKILTEKNTVFHEWNEIMKHIDEDYINKDVNTILKKYKL
jgi:hypothetical protein